MWGAGRNSSSKLQHQQLISSCQHGIGGGFGSQLGGLTLPFCGADIACTYDWLSQGRGGLLRLGFRCCTGPAGS